MNRSPKLPTFHHQELRHQLFQRLYMSTNLNYLCHSHCIGRASRCLLNWKFVCQWHSFNEIYKTIFLWHSSPSASIMYVSRPPTSLCEWNLGESVHCSLQQQIDWTHHCLNTIGRWFFIININFVILKQNIFYILLHKDIKYFQVF